VTKFGCKGRTGLSQSCARSGSATTSTSSGLVAYKFAAVSRNSGARMARYVVAWFVAVAIGFAGATASAQSRAASVLGISTHFAQGNGDPDVLVPLMQKSGWNALRDEIYWSHVQSSDGTMRIPMRIIDLVSAARANGLQLILVLGYSHPSLDHRKPLTADERRAFARYARFVAQELGDAVLAFEVWNEWDIEVGGAAGGRAEDYMALLRDVVSAIRDVAPKAHIIGGSATPEHVDRGYLRELVRLGLLDLVDAVSIHPYVWTRADSSASAVMKWLRNVQQYTRGKPLYITEVGWPTHAESGLFNLTNFFRRIPSGVTEEGQRQRVCALAQLVAGDPAIKGLFFYGLLDEGSNAGEPEHRFGLIRRDGRQRSGFMIRSCAAPSTR
jgi:hypothetical protein